MGMTNNAMSNEQKAYRIMQEIAQAINEKRLEDAKYLCFQFLGICSTGQEAVKVSDLLVKLDRNNPDAYNFLGIAYASVDKLVEAGKAYGRAMQIDPKHGMAIMNYANLISKFGQLKEALPLYEQALQCLEKKYHVSVYTNMANLYLDRKQFDMALECVAKAKKINDKDASVYSVSGNIYGAKEDVENAEKNYLKCLQIDGNRIVVIENLATLYDKKGNTVKAKHYLEKGFKIRQKINGHCNVARWMILGAGALKNLYMTYLVDKVEGVNYRILLNKNLDEAIKLHPDELIYKAIDGHRFVVKQTDVGIATNEWYILKDGCKYSNMTFHVAGNSKIFSASNHFSQTCELLPHGFEEKVSEPIIILGGANNYYHWLCDYLPRIDMLKHCPELDGLPIFVNEDFADFQLKTLELIGFDTKRLRKAKDGGVYHVHEAYLLHFNGRPLFENNPDWMKPAVTKQEIDWIRQTFSPWMKPSKKMPKRLFLSRKDAKFRRCINEDAVFEVARQYGFEKVQNENLTFEEQMQLYSGVEAVMGVHGAGFTNMVFAPSDARIIELHSKDELPPFYQHMASLIGQKHYSIDGIVTHALQPLTPPFWDFEVDEQKVKSLMKDIFEGE